MWEQVIIASPPVLLLIVLVGWGLFMKRAGDFQMLADPKWPEAENPGLSLELADSITDVDEVIGKDSTPAGTHNRRVGARLQYLDFLFIPLYVAFFTTTALMRTGRAWGWVAIAPAVLTGLCDVAEDVQILRMLRGKSGVSARGFGRAKWFFYFATIAAEGVLFFVVGGASAFREAAGMLFGLTLIALAVGGGISALKGSFEGISSATRLSALALLGLALAPLLALYPFSWGESAQYTVFLRVPLLLGLVLLALPFVAFFSGAKTLLRGLFDLTPLSLFVVTLAALATAGTVCTTASVIIKNGAARLGVGHSYTQSLLPAWGWLVIMAGLSLPVVGFSLWFSIKQEHNTGGLVVAALTGAAVALSAAYFLITSNGSLITLIIPTISDPRFKDYLSKTGLFAGYVQPGSPDDPWPEHLRALTAFALTFVLYIVIGAFGWRQLGKKRMVPALCSALMLMLMLGWLLSGVAFFFDAWHVPTLLIVGAVGVLTAQSRRSDHFYHLRKTKEPSDAPDPYTTIARRSRVIVAAANGGGIQAGAWAAQVLYGLNEDEECGEAFERSLRMISSVSGGSVGNACFVHWLANKDTARQPHKAAAMSSLDEVTWGLVWPDFLRALLPWLLGGLMGRGRALERAWILNSARRASAPGKMDKPLSSWNEKVAAGDLPAVVMNATIAETGERLLLATTRLVNKADGRARVDATELHTINRERFDVGVVTAARLSASFPYVTPAARGNQPGPLPHVVDGGYYDNYGMATMVEWLDEALAGARGEIESVLVIQIHGAPVNPDAPDKRRARNRVKRDSRSESADAASQIGKQRAKGRGWFYQAFAPLQTLLSVRTAGQVAHNDIELELLQQKWAAKVPIHTVTFEFQNPDAPLSWHLTPTEVHEIKRAWHEDMEPCKQLVREFLAGNDCLECGCVMCKSAYCAP